MYNVSQYREKVIYLNNNYLLDLALTLIWKNNIQCNVLHVLPNSNIEEEICEFPSFLGFLILWIFTWKKSYSTMKSFWWFHFLIIGFAEKRCTENGTWYLNSDHSEWTNFTTCGQTDVHLKQEYVHVILYGFSVIALTPAIIIFFAYKYVVAEDKFFENNLHFYTNAKSFPHFLILTEYWEFHELPSTKIYLPPYCYIAFLWLHSNVPYSCHIFKIWVKQHGLEMLVCLLLEA